MTFDTVTVFSLPNCPACRTTKMILDKSDVPYREVMLDQDSEASDYVASLGHKQAPVVVTPDGHHWSGLNPFELSKLA